MYRPGGYRGSAGRPGASKASADTLCQKCLKKGHYSYECTASTQERPYKSRPSRTQQLLNPQLKPKLMMDVPNDLLKKKGIADEILAKKEEDRGRKPNGNADGRRKRSRSASSSVDSVSTISTDRSRSRPRSPKRREGTPRHTSGGKLGKRGRRSVSSDSYDSDRSDDRREARERNTRRRMSSFSPGQRGRRRSRSGSSRMETSQDHAPRFRTRKGPISLSRSRSRGRAKPSRRLSVSRSPSRERRERRRRSPSDPMDTSDDREPPKIKPARGSRSPSPYRPGSGRGRSPSPYSRRSARRSPSPVRGQNGHRVSRLERGGRARQFNDRRPESEARHAPPAPPAQQQRERSLSPYSKRVALTRQMATG
ncbi:zinc knuckle-domain-containing protein [Lophiotrema nucula]|uniref:Zinc knuckle-domain-containing protein n=1 Tax=Lophiotrema nucula TaxID=690887 RepID=A0A6A5ZF17_9PLEO|nr:zinc knuckle-domain-containing protein [Lophiotrema nucula]